jgi:hypothetical protein
MAYVDGFKFDFFASHAHIDNQRFGPARPPWVNCLVAQLAKTIQMRLGTREGIKAYFDGHGSVEAGRRLTSDLTCSASASAIFVAVISPAYVNEGSWALGELRAFAKAARTHQRIFPIELLPLENERDYPPAVRNLARFKFWTLNKDRVPVPISPASVLFYDSVWVLGDQMQRHLKSMRQALGPSSPEAHSAAPLSGQLAFTRAGSTP